MAAKFAHGRLANPTHPIVDSLRDFSRLSETYLRVYVLPRPGPISGRRSGVWRGILSGFGYWDNSLLGDSVEAFADLDVGRQAERNIFRACAGSYSHCADSDSSSYQALQRGRPVARHGSAVNGDSEGTELASVRE